jgi:glycosyltransferase involved in cell wall biosynthesis
MRVLLCHQPTDGGVGRHVRDVADGLSAAGHEVVLCSPAMPGGVSPSVGHVRLDLRRAVAPRADLTALVRLTAVLGDVRPDVVHAHSSKAGALARLARVASPRVPVVYTPHGFAFAGHFSSPLERHAYRAVERLLMPLASRIVCVCEAEARLARSLGVPDRVRVVRNGIDPAPAGAIDERIAELSRRGPVVGTVSQLRPGKGLETLIAATPKVLASHPNAQVVIVGDGPDLPELRDRARACGVAHAVHFLGGSTDPLGMLRGMDVFVQASWAESFPYVILEAMSLGVAIVATDVGGVNEALADGESGLLVEPRSDRALAAAVIELLGDPGRRTELGAAALLRAGRFTRTAMVERLTEVYEEVAQPRGRSFTPRPGPSMITGR